MEKEEMLHLNRKGNELDNHYDDDVYYGNEKQDKTVDGDVIVQRRHSSAVIQDNETRGVWGNKLEFFLAIMGYTVGIGSVWRFPITCSRNGGGAFLIPFFFFLITAGGPLYYMEVCLGQFTGKSAGLSFEYCPLFKGLGFLQVSLATTVQWYGIFVSAWVYYFLYSSFFPELPWAKCGHDWNTPKCVAIIDDDKIQPNSSLEKKFASYNTSTEHKFALAFKNGTDYQSSAFEFWEYKVIGRSSGLDDMGSLQPHLVICSFIALFLVALAVIKGVKTLGKVVYVTATMPYVFLIIMFIRGLTLPGCMDGIITYLNPDFSKLLTVQVWLEAAIQVFYSLGPTWGGVITMASYNKFHQKSFWASTMCVASSGFTSFFNGLVVFTILGFMANESGMTVQEVATQSGPGLTFVAFPTALAQMPLPQLWSVLFFIMLVTVTFDSAFGMFETVTSGVIDLFPRQLTSRRVLVNICVALTLFILGLPLTMNGGIYLFQLSDWYFSTFALLIGSLFECISICWIYGTDRFSRDITMMTGRDVSASLRCMWTIVIPVFVTVAFVTMLSQYSAPAYGDGYVYSSSAISFGISVGMLPIVGLIIVAVVVLVRAEGSFVQRLRKSLRPSSKWHPNDESANQEYMISSYVYPDTWWTRFILNIRGTKNDPIF